MSKALLSNPRTIGLVSALCCALTVALFALPAAASAETCPNEQLRAEDQSTSLPDCRAYELVSPPYKQGHPIYIAERSRDISTDGSHVIAVGFGVFAGAEDDPPGDSFGAGATYELSRTPVGWLAQSITPPATQFGEDAFQQQLVSSDFGTTTWVLNTPAQFLQQRDLYLRSPEGTFARVGPMTPPGAANNDDARPLEGSSDLSHVLFVLYETRWPGDTTLTEGVATTVTPSLYEASGRIGAEPKLVGVSNEGPLASNAEAHLIGQCGTALGAESKSSHTVSADGKTVFFVAQGESTGLCGERLGHLERCEAEGKSANECEERFGARPAGPEVSEVYARVAASRTIAISEPVLPAGQCAGACAAAAHEEGVFQGASADGSKVFFLTTQPLLNGDTDSTNDLYEAEITGAGVQKLRQVSIGDASDPTPGSGARVLGVSAISDDGSRVYFAAEGVLTTGANKEGEKATSGMPNLYVVEPASGTTTFITTLTSSDSEDWLPSSSSVEVTPDGRFLVFGSAGGLLEYDSQTGLVNPVASEGFGPLLSNDGSYVFFDSAAALTPKAISGRNHVYEYHGNHVYLISDGVDIEGEGAKLTGIDPSGENVFFETFDRLVSQDTDNQTDIYDARVNGGFPAVAVPAGCSGEGCQGPSATPPSTPTAASVTQPGGGNLSPPLIRLKPALTPRQKLATALKKCRSKHNKRKRQSCEAAARRRYTGRARARKSRHFAQATNGRAK
jgi:hypothetical protein